MPNDLFADVEETPATIVAKCVNDDCPFVRIPRTREEGEVTCGFCRFPLVGAKHDE